MKRSNLIKLSLILVFIIIVIFGAMKIFGSFLTTGNNVQDTIKQTGENFKEFNIKAFRFSYTPNEITVNKWDRVKINIENIDTLHGIRIPELGLSGNDFIEFTADKTGTFTWYCNNVCGEGHRSMTGYLIVR